MPEEPQLRIGELSRRAGVSPELLRAWERRYGLLEPQRSPGGLRLYTEADLERVRAMRRHLANGLAAAEAAAEALRAPAAGEAGEHPGGLGSVRDDLASALDRFDEPWAQAVLDRLFATVGLDTALGDVLLPYLHDLGRRWERGEVTVAQEHFASGVLRGRLLSLARGWGVGVGPLALLACLPDERHDLGLIAFGLALRARGWRIAYLGPDTPVETVEDTAGRLEPELVVLNGVTAERIEAVLEDLAGLAAEHRLAVGGAGVEGAELERAGVIALAGGPIDEAERLSALALQG